MGLIKGLLNIAYTPVEIVKDIVTMGGALTEENETYTMRRLREAQKQIDETLKD